ncbi:AAA family ATPase [Candidatus Beckwithbacteria bacterium CG23_combo_of_CG06-09_8_20_14_all_34_8]|uniref:AAA family ATPase n=2 Tax=Microgenomates group TaxID=1794810 RepID=A0A2H0B7T8_9BACT|nr:MAG: AAA family ATPase [Candidatus Beckwithbacteria bacterium CG23_combo_of_CG06-09_8_20_14_all_34_8]PIU37032.1 MAG: AAA family ATPase [Candidatus Roizmanbacteria bacterium CG07_land_8_20_14_0_80_34_15]
MTQSQALSILKTGANVFLTGEPGAGKTHLINEYVIYLRANDINVAVTASTGIAATHIGGMTIHSWSGIGIKTKLEKSDLNKIKTSQYIVRRITKSKVLIIEEISMLTGGTLSMVDTVCREIKQNSKPFGGIQVIFAGDFFQLPPVVRREYQENIQTSILAKSSSFFAFDSSSWKELNPIVCYLTEQHRQEDGDFLELLSAIRENKFNKKHLSHIETRRLRLLDPIHDKSLKNIPKLFSHNIDVDSINQAMLKSIKGEQKTFIITVTGPDPLVTTLVRGCLSPEILYLKIGASVMFTKNNPKEGFVNGTLGVVDGFDKISGNPIVKIRSGQKIEVGQMDWSIEENGKVKASISQLPLRLAWAITVHKSQGMSLDEAIMDLSQVFEYGQGYVALSRVRRLTGLYILGWNEKTFQVHPEILEKDKEFRIDSKNVENIFSGITPVELQKRQDDFIRVCNGKPKSAFSEKLDTYTETLLLWNEGKDAKQISELRKFTEGTILSHIEKLFLKDKIKRSDLSRILTPTLKDSLVKIHAVFHELDTDKLSPVFEKFNGKFSYEELRIARMLLSKRITM